MKEYLDFMYDGVSSKELGIIQAYRDLDVFEEGFLSSRNIIEEKIRGSDTPIFLDVENDPLQFELGLFFSKELGNVEKRKIARMFNKDGYKPLIFNEEKDQIFYCMLIDESQITHKGTKSGFLTLTMRCDSPYSYSPFYRTDDYHIEDNNLDNPINITNKGDVDIKPIIYIKKIDGVGDIRIKTFTSSKEMLVKDVYDNEEITIDCNLEDIKTDHPNMERYDHFNDEYISIPTGSNDIVVEGNCIVRIEYRYKFVQIN